MHVEYYDYKGSYSRSRVFNKAVGATEAATTDLDTIGWVSATVLYLLEYSDCATWQTTADVIFARNEFFGLGLSKTDILDLAEKHVRKHFETFYSQCDCWDYTPKKMPGTVLEKPFDWDEPLVLNPGEVPGVSTMDPKNQPNETFKKYIKYAKNILEKCKDRLNQDGRIETKYTLVVELPFSINHVLVYYFELDASGKKIQPISLLTIPGEATYGHLLIPGSPPLNLVFDLCDVCNIPLKISKTDSQLTRLYKSLWNHEELHLVFSLQCFFEGTHPKTGKKTYIVHSLTTGKGNFGYENDSGDVVNYTVEGHQVI